MRGRVWIAGLTGTDAPVRRPRLRPTLALLLVAAVAVAADCSGATAAPTVASAAAASKVCAKLGATSAVVARIFGVGAKTSTYKATTTTYCDITPPGVSRDACATHECTDVFDYTTGLQYNVSGWEATLTKYTSGRVSAVPVAGAGTGAVLVKDTKYGSSYGLGPVLFFAVGAGTIAIQGSLGGPPAFKEWEALARAIHAHLG